MGLKKLSWNWKVHKLQVPLLVFMHTHALTHTHTHTQRVDLLLSFWLLDGSGPLTSRTPHPSVQKGGKNEIIIEKEGKKKKKKIKILIQKNVWDFAYARGFA